MSRSELYNRFRHTRNIQHMVIVCQCCEPLFVFNGLWRWSLWFRALSCHVQNFTIVSDIHEIYSTWSSFVSVVNHCLFSTGLWRWSLWFRALSSWRRLDSWGVETGEICDNTGEICVKDIRRLLHCFFSPPVR